MWSLTPWSSLKPAFFLIRSNERKAFFSAVFSERGRCVSLCAVIDLRSWRYAEPGRCLPWSKCTLKLLEIGMKTWKREVCKFTRFFFFRKWCLSSLEKRPMIKKAAVVFFLSSIEHIVTVDAPLLGMTNTGAHWMLHIRETGLIAVRIGLYSSYETTFGTRMAYFPYPH